MLPAASTFQTDETTMSRTCAVSPLCISLDATPVVREEISPSDATKSPDKEPLAIDYSPNSNEGTKLNVVLEIQRKRPYSPEECDSNNKRCCTRLEYRKDSESGFSSATEDTNDIVVINKHSSCDIIDISSSPESAIAYLFSPPSKSILPSVTSPYNYPRDYSFCSGKRPNHKPLNLTTECVDNKLSIQANKKICLNTINKNIYHEPEQYKIQDKEYTKEKNNAVNSNPLQNLSMNLQCQVYFPPDAVPEVNTGDEMSSPMDLQHKSFVTSETTVIDRENHSMPSNLQNYKEGTTHTDYNKTQSLIPQNCAQNLFESVPIGDTLTSTIQNKTADFVSTNAVPNITQNKVNLENTNIVTKSTEFENQSVEPNTDKLCQTDHLQQATVINVTPELQAQDNDNICDTDLASQCLQEFFKTWNVNCSPDIIAGYTDAPLADPSVYANSDVVGLPVFPQAIASEILLNQSTICIISDSQTVNQFIDISQQEKMEPSHNDLEAKELPESMEVLHDENKSTMEMRQDEKEVCSDTLKNICPLLSMPLLGGEPELPPIPEQQEEVEKEEQQEKKEPESQESMSGLILDTPETQNTETNLSQCSTQTKIQTPPHTSVEYEATSPELDMLQKIMKPTLPQNSTLAYSRFFGSDHSFESFLSRPSVSPKASIPVFLSVGVAKSRTPTPKTPTRIQPKRGVSLGSISSNSPDLSLTPKTRNMRRNMAAVTSYGTTPTIDQQDPLTSSPMKTESTGNFDEDYTSNVSSPASLIHTTPIHVPIRRGRGRPKSSILSAVSSPGVQSNTQQDLIRSQSPVTRNRKKNMSPALLESSKVNYLSPVLESKFLPLDSEKPESPRTKQGPGRGRSNSLSIQGAQSPSIKGAKGRGRSHSPAVRSKVKRVEEIKSAIEKNAPGLSASDLFVQREREKMLQYDSWMEQRREMYSKLIPDVQIPHTSCSNMQPKVILERNPGLDARAISEAALAKLQSERGVKM